MRDLRVRLGFILALALMPLLMFSIWRSYSDYNRDQALLRSNTDLTARIALAEIVGSFDTTRSILRFSSTLLADKDCKADLSRLADEYSRLYNIIQSDGTGEVLCSAKPVRSTQEQAISLLEQVSAETPYVTEIYTLPSPNGEPETVIATAFGIFENDEMTAVFVAVEDINYLLDLLQKSKVLKETEVAVFNRSGQLLGGVWNKDDLQYIAQSLPSKTLEGRFATKDANGAPLLVLPTSADQIYLAVASEKKGILSWNKFNPLSSAIIPILAWLFGFIAIWLTTDRLILLHLRRMRRATLAFAKGDRSARVGKMKKPPSSIASLGENFDTMADRIVAREETISDSLDEKETLLREIHHRVKNNLQIIISLLNMQERKLTDAQGLEAIVETRNRINAIALVHRGLYESVDLRYVDIKTFLTRLLPELALALGFDQNGITVSTKVTCEPMEADTATPVALFIVEALTNAVKHGVSRGGHIAIAVTQNGNAIQVSVSDEGTHASSSDGVSSGTGTKLMKGFARQLGGTLKNNVGDSGYEVSLNFTPRHV